MKFETKKQALGFIKSERLKGKTNLTIQKFATKRKKQFFVGTWSEWLLQIS